jgi:hypothetical protein
MARGQTASTLGYDLLKKIAHEPLLSVPRLDPNRFLLGLCYSQTQTVALHSHEQILVRFQLLSGCEFGITRQGLASEHPQ